MAGFFSSFNLVQNSIVIMNLSISHFFVQNVSKIAHFLTRLAQMCQMRTFPWCSRWSERGSSCRSLWAPHVVLLTCSNPLISYGTVDVNKYSTQFRIVCCFIVLNSQQLMMFSPWGEFKQCSSLPSQLQEGGRGGSTKPPRQEVRREGEGGGKGV